MFRHLTNTMAGPAYHVARPIFPSSPPHRGPNAKAKDRRLHGREHASRDFLGRSRRPGFPGARRPRQDPVADFGDVQGPACMLPRAATHRRLRLHWSDFHAFGWTLPLPPGPTGPPGINSSSRWERHNAWSQFCRKSFVLESQSPQRHGCLIHPIFRNFRP